jgi:hypothetical protein
LTTDRLDARPRNGLFSEVAHNVNNGRHQAIYHLPALPDSDSKRKAGHQRVPVKGIKSADRFVI